MFAAFAKLSFTHPILSKQQLLYKTVRSFSVIEDKLSLIDLFGDNDDGDEYDHNGIKLPPFGSLISFTTQRQYNIGIYEGTKMIDGIQKLQVRNEHNCIRDVGINCLNCLLALPSPIIQSYSGDDLTLLKKQINHVYQTSHIPVDRIYTKFQQYNRFNVQQAIPFLSSKLRKSTNEIVLIGVLDRVLHNSNYLFEKLENNWSCYNEYKCHPKQYLSLLKSNFQRNEDINTIYHNSYGFTTKDCDTFVNEYKTITEENRTDFIKKYQTIINALILLSNVFSPTENTYENYSLLRDHILLPLFGTKNEEGKYANETISKINYYTGDILRYLQILPSFTLPQFLLDSKCGYTPFTPNCQKAAQKILDTFFSTTQSKRTEDLPWEFIDEYENTRSSFHNVAIAIDSISTSEVDDSISVLGPNHVAIHIADPTSFIPLGSELDFNASLRSVTYYYPNQVYPLYPWEIATTCSLSTTQFADAQPNNRYNLTELPDISQNPIITPKPRALTIEIEFNEDGSIGDYSIHCTVLQNPIRLTYEEVESLLKPKQTKTTKQFTLSSIPVVKETSVYSQLESLQDKTQSKAGYEKRQECPSNALILGFNKQETTNSHNRETIMKRVTSNEVTAEAIESTLNHLFELAEKRRRYREERGSIDFVFSEPRFHIHDGIVDGYIDSSSSSLQSEELVMEMMVAAGEVIGLLGKENSLPLPYRSHPYNLQLPADQMHNRFASSPITYPSIVYNWEQLIRCLPAKITRTAEPHSGLGINSYVQVTSPLRRYNDCLVHRQIKAFINNQPLPYDEDTMFRVSSRCFQLEKKSTKFEDMWNRYIILQRMKDLLKENGSLQVHGTVLETSLRGLNTVVCGVVLNDLNIRCNVSCTTVIPKGSQVDIDILDVIPDCLRIKLALTGSLRTEESVDYSKVL